MWRWVVGLVGCDWIPLPEAPPPPDPPAENSVVQIVAGSAPWSTVQVRTSVSWKLEVLVDGEPLGQVAPSTYVPDTWFEVGLHEITLPGFPDVEPVTFETRPFGQEPQFDPEGIVGRSWSLDDAGVVIEPRSVGDWVTQYLGDLRFEVLAADPDAGTVAFRLASLPGCSVLEATAQVSETGELWWSTELVEVDTPDGVGRLWDLSLHLGFSGEDIGGVEVGGIVDTAPWALSIEPPGDEHGICNLIGIFGARCSPCPDDGADTCVVWESVDAELTPVGDALRADLPTCGGPEGPVTLCSTASAVVPMSVLWFLWACAPRRRKASAR